MLNECFWRHSIQLYTTYKCFIFKRSMVGLGISISLYTQLFLCVIKKKANLEYFPLFLLNIKFCSTFISNFIPISFMNILSQVVYFNWNSFLCEIILYSQLLDTIFLLTILHVSLFFLFVCLFVCFLVFFGANLSAFYMPGIVLEAGVTIIEIFSHD